MAGSGELLRVGSCVLVEWKLGRDLLYRHCRKAGSERRAWETVRGQTVHEQPRGLWRWIDRYSRVQDKFSLFSGELRACIVHRICGAYRRIACLLVHS